MNKMWTLNQNTCDGSGNIQVCKICMRECRCSCEKELVGGGYWICLDKGLEGIGSEIVVSKNKELVF